MPNTKPYTLAGTTEGDRLIPSRRDNFEETFLSFFISTGGTDIIHTPTVSQG